MNPVHVPPLTQYMGSALMGSLVSQIAHARGIDPSSLFNPGGAGLAPSATRILEELVAHGVDPAALGANALAALCLLLLDPDNAALLIDQFARLLWTTLGDPDSGGATPPEVYRRAGCALHLVLVGLLQPENDPLHPSPL